MGDSTSGEALRTAMREHIDELEKQHLVDQQVIDRLEAEGVIERDKLANLEVALVTCRHIGAAIGILMERQKVTQEEAFALLIGTSQRSHVKLREVADRLMLTGELSG